jgi:hypothetical protein
MEGFAQTGREQGLKNKRPPRLATWLLLNLSCHPDDEAILGDLTEAFEKRQSSLWYWRQVFVAILNSFVRETWRHKYNSALALVVGWLSLGLIWFLLEVISGHPFAWSRHACTFFWCIAGMGSGSLVGLLTRDRKSAMICLYAASVSLFLALMHRAPQSHPVIYWIDTIALTTSILLAAVPIGMTSRQSVAPSGENR